MRVVRNIVNNNRTIVCTIHQPSAEIFLHFDELLLLKRGGRTIYYGEMGDRSATLVDYFQSVEGSKKLQSGYNPATYMLEVRHTVSLRFGFEAAVALVAVSPHICTAHGFVRHMGLELVKWC